MINIKSDVRRKEMIENGVCKVCCTSIENSEQL